MAINHLFSSLYGLIRNSNLLAQNNNNILTIHNYSQDKETLLTLKKCRYFCISIQSKTDLHWRISKIVLFHTLNAWINDYILCKKESSILSKNFLRSIEFTKIYIWYDELERKQFPCHLINASTKCKLFWFYQTTIMLTLQSYK